MSITYNKTIKVIKSINDWLMYGFMVLVTVCFIAYFVKGAPQFDYKSMAPKSASNIN